MLRLESISISPISDHTSCTAGYLHTQRENWNVCREESLNICSWSDGFIRFIWNTKIRALSFTITNNTYFIIYTGTKLWTGDQCSGQTHLIYIYILFSKLLKYLIRHFNIVGVPINRWSINDS